MSPTKSSLSTELISTQAVDLYRLSSDASHFHLIPAGVATPSTTKEISALLIHAAEKKSSVTFRSGGTSLSGQGVSDAILIDTRKYFRTIEVLDGGARVRVQPGATVRAVNARLARFGRKLGPDPASEIACTIGGVIANNASGMACGITENTYRTLESATVVLANGAKINTADSDSDAQLRLIAPELHHAISELRDEITSRPELIAEVQRQYSIKNTMGYGLNSFIDYSRVIDIFLHLLIGSEGTLGFISEAIFNTVPLLSHAATTLLIFTDLETATNSLPTLMETRPATIELMDSASLRAGKVDLGGVELHEHAALLVEYQSEDESALLAKIEGSQTTLSALPTVNTPALTTDPKIRAELWHIRKGLYAAVAGARRSGTTALLEDISVPVHELASTCLELHALFARHGYDDAVIFGHAKDGNIHFLVNEDFTVPTFADRYRTFTEEMVALVLSKGGSLKAEHGTGRMMAPFVERQFGSELYGMMVRVKRAFDPAGVLNPGVIISEDSLAHMHNIKFHPKIAKIADNCVECGYCEPICPSKDLTTTPRQRIVLQRAIASAKSDGDTQLHRELLESSQYYVEESCAVDGLCENSCPVGINTGALVTNLRSKRSSGIEEGIWDLAAEHWGVVLNAISSALTLIRSLPSQMITPINQALRRYLGEERIPLWSKHLPKGGSARKAVKAQRPDFILFASCLGSIFKAESAQSLISIAKKAGLSFSTPDGINDLCCATPWKSKGHVDGYDSMVEKTYQAILTASENGRLPIVCENSSCSEGLVKAIRTKAGSRLRILDSVDFALEFLLPHLEITEKKGSIALHPTCSTTNIGGTEKLQELALSIGDRVTIPAEWGCCAFAGDRGLLHPELTASATRAEAASVNSENFDAYISTNLTCEIAMSRATGNGYQHILVLLDQVATGKE